MQGIEEIDLLITVIVGTIVMFFMVVVIVWSVVQYQKRVLKQQEELRMNEKKYQKSLLEAQIIISERERQEVSKNIHDDVGMILNVIKLNQSKLKKNISNTQLVQDILSTNNQLLNEVVENVKAISNNLISPTLQRLGCVEALKMLAQQINQSNEIFVEINNAGFNTRLESMMELNLFRVCKEVLNNILKHGGTTKIAINLLQAQNILFISFLYHGKGLNDLDVESKIQNSKGLGLKSIISRIQILSATITYKNNNNVSEILINLPVKL